MRRKRTGVGDYQFGARLHREIAQPLGVPFACSRKTDDGSRDCLARWLDYAPVMEGLDGKFECDAQETRGLWIEPLPVKILSDRHQQSGPWKWGGRRWGHPSGLAAKFARPACLGSFMVPKITAVCLVSDVIVRILGASAAISAKLFEHEGPLPHPAGDQPQ